MKKIATLIAALTLAAPAFAAPETYNVDSTHTFARFSYSHFGMSTQLSKFNKTTGTVVLDKAAKTGSVDVVIDTKSVDTGYDTFNEHIQGEDFLDTAKYPTATFKSTKVTFVGDKPATIDGELTIKGVTKPVALKVRVPPVSGWAKAAAVGMVTGWAPVPLTPGSVPTWTGVSLVPAMRTVTCCSGRSVLTIFLMLIPVAPCR